MPKLRNPIDAIVDLMFIVSFRAITKRVYLVNKKNGWWDSKRNFGEMIALVHSELSEALEARRRGDPESDHLPNVKHVGEEFADTVIRLLDIAFSESMDLAKIILAKIEFNKTREKKHGKEF